MKHIITSLTLIIFFSIHARAEEVTPLLLGKDDHLKEKKIVPPDIQDTVSFSLPLSESFRLVGAPRLLGQGITRTDQQEPKGVGFQWKIEF